jgi:alpha-beta hydrolase superfamily lysophospholipase
MRSRFNRRAIVLSAAAMIPATILSKEATATAQTPIPDVSLPEGPLGEQIAWVMQIINGNPATLTGADITAHVDKSVLAQVPAKTLIAAITQVSTQYGPFTIEPNSMVTTRDMPPTTARFVIVGKNDMRLRASIAVNRESGLITSLNFTPAPAATPAASPVATPVLTNATDTDVSFQSGPDTIYGSFMQPKSGATGAAALIISGSGPTDRNGNQSTLTVANTNLNIATTLADAGVSSLRYDKLGSGQTGLGTHLDGKGITYQLFLTEAQDAGKELLGEPGVDASKLILIGHSEGALFALVLAQDLVTKGTPPAALILVSPLSIRYLDIITEQVTAQYVTSVASGLTTQAQSDAALKELAAIVTQLRTKGTVPAKIETDALQQLFTPGSAAFLAEIDKIDPATVAASLPASLPVLVLHGTKDQQISNADVAHLMAGFTKAGNTSASLVTVPNANHLMKVVEGTPNAAVDYANPNLPFSPDAVKAIDSFLKANGLAK